MAGSRIESFELASDGLRLGRSKLLLQHRDNCIIPGVVKIPLRRRNVDLLARPAAIGVSGGMERLMYIAYEIDQKREVDLRSPFVVIAVAKTTSILVDFRRDAISAWAPRRQIRFAVLQADVDVMPGSR